MDNWNPSDGCPICINNLDTEDGALYECCKCNKTFTGDGSEVIEAIETEHEQLSKYIQAMALLSTVLPWRKIDACDPMSLVREVMDDIAAAQEREAATNAEVKRLTAELSPLGLVAPYIVRQTDNTK